MNVGLIISALVFIIVLIIVFVDVVTDKSDNTMDYLASDSIGVENNESYRSDKFEKITDYKELLDTGAITEEEFDRKKKEILEL